MNFKITSISDKFDNKQDNLKIKIEQIVTDFDKKIFEMKDILNNNIDQSKNRLYDQIDYAKEQLIQLQKSELEKYNQKLEKTGTIINEKVAKIVDKNKKQIGKIKEICASFFKSYEDSLQNLKNQFIDVYDAFQTWNRNVVRPNELKEATLYSLEQRMNNEEISRLNDIMLLKDVISKLIYSLNSHVTC